MAKTQALLDSTVMYCNRECTDATVSTTGSVSSTDQSGSRPISKRVSNFFAGGRRQSCIWSLFTDADSPHKLKSAMCRHCKMLRHYYKKSEIVLRHLLKCSGFREYAKSLDECDFSKWHTKKMNLSSENGSNKDRKHAMYDQIKDYTIAANIEKQKNSFHYEMLVQGKRTRLEYWLTDGADWPLLQEIAVKLFSSSVSSISPELPSLSSFDSIHSKLRNWISDDAIKKETLDCCRMSTEQNTPGTSRPKRQASLQSVSMIKHLVALSSVCRRKRKAPVVDSQETSKKEPKRSASPVEANFSLADLDDTLFPTDNGLEYRLGARLRAQDEFGKWYTAKIIEINPENGKMLIHFDYWSQRYDEWIPANSDRLIPLDNAVETRVNFEPLQVGDFVFAKWGETGTYPAQIVEFLESDRYKLLYYDGFEKVAHRRDLKKMTDEEVKQLDLVNFGRLKILPTYPNVMFDPNLAGKLHDLGSRRRSSKNANLGNSAVNSPKCDTPLSATDDDRMTPKMEPSEDNDVGQVVDKATMKPLPQRKSLNLRCVDKNSTENAKKALSKSKSIVKAAKNFCNKRQTISTSNSSIDLRPDSDISTPSENSDDSRTLSNIKEQQLDELPLQSFISKRDVSSVERELFGDFAAKTCPPRLVLFTQEDDEKMCEFVYELLENNQITGADIPFSRAVWSKCHDRGLLLNHSTDSLGMHMRRIFSKFNDIRKCLRSSVAKKLFKTYESWIGSADGSGVRPLARYDRRKLSAKSSPSADQSFNNAENVATPVHESSQRMTDFDDSSIRASAKKLTDTMPSSQNNSASEDQSRKKMRRSISSSSHGTSQCVSVFMLVDEVLEAKSWMVGRESWLKHDPVKDEYFCGICRPFYPKGNAGRSGRFLDGIPLPFFSVRRVRDHENSSMHGRAVVWWNIEHEDEAVPLLLCNGYYLERCEVPNVKQALTIGQKSKDNNFTRILFNRRKNNRHTYAECQSKEVLNDSETSPTVSPKKAHLTLEQPRKIADNDSIYWLRQDKESIFCSACKKYGKPENVSPKYGFFDRNSDDATYSEHSKLAGHHEALKQMFVEQNCVTQRHMKRLEEQRKEFESGCYNCPASFCSMNFEKKEDLEGHIDLVHRRNVSKEKQPIISCICDINQEDDAMIQCFQCSTLQHKKCFDIQQNRDFGSFYCCYSCADDNESATSFRVEIESDIVFAITGQLPRIDGNHQVLPPINDLQTLNTCYQDVLNILERLNHMDRQMKSIHSTGNQTVEKDKQLTALQEEMDKKLDDIDQIVTEMEVGNFVQSSVINGILSDRISHWSSFLRNYVLDKVMISHVETLAFYQEIIDGLFSPDQNYLLLTPDYYYSDCAELVNFLAPDGLMFSFIDLLLNDRSASFEFFFKTVHQDTRDKIFGGKNLQFTREKLDFSQNLLRCNAFDYYFYRFFDYIYTAVERGANNFDFSEAKFDRVPYFVLFTEYLIHFLPTDKFISPLLSKNDEKSMISTSALKIGRNYTGERRCTPLGLIRREYLTNVDSSYSRFGVTENDSIVQADDYFSKICDFLYILADLWLYRSRLNPRTDCFITILLTSLLRHVYRFIFCIQSLINEQFTTQLLSFKEDLMRKILAPNFFVYFGLSFNYWPLDSSFDHLCRLWLTFLQPWQINQQNFDQNFVRTYETFYAKFFPIVVRRFLRTEFVNSSKMAQCLSSVLRFFDRNLLNYVHFNDKDFQSLLMALAENLAVVDDNCEQKLREVECRKKRENVAQKFGWFWQNIGQETDREQCVENLTFIQDNSRQSLEFLKRNFDIDISLSPSRKILSCVRTSSGIYDQSSPKLIEQINGKLKLTPEGRQKILNKSINFDSDANRSLDSAMFVDESSFFKQEIDHSPADLSAVHSDEIEFLANFWTFVSSLINRRYGEQFKEAYGSSGITGFVSRCLLYGPFNEGIIGKVGKCRKESSCPRLSLRFMASYYFICFYIFVILCFWSCFSVNPILFIIGTSLFLLLFVTFMLLL